MTLFHASPQLKNELNNERENKHSANERKKFAVGAQKSAQCLLLIRYFIISIALFARDTKLLSFQDDDAEEEEPVQFKKKNIARPDRMSSMFGLSRVCRY